MFTFIVPYHESVFFSPSVVSRDKQTVIAYLLMKLSFDSLGVLQPVPNNSHYFNVLEVAMFVYFLNYVINICTCAEVRISKFCSFLSR